MIGARLLDRPAGQGTVKDVHHVSVATIGPDHGVAHSPAGSGALSEHAGPGPSPPLRCGAVRMIDRLVGAVRRSPR
ncbi:hypothetical protein T261_8025 [Streptomyces lydicus]|nr:hypothetical protein T261_8025 [Streptomyces lydicus]